MTIEANIENVYLNIPVSNIVASDVERTKTRATVELLQSAKLMIPLFSIIQFMQGAEIWLGEQKGTIHVHLMRLFVKLANSLPNVGNDMTKSMQFGLSYDELCTLRIWLELRMKHCEEERDQRIPAIDKDGFPIPGVYKFNPDSYIAMKLLLLDIRELMLGNIIVE